MKKLLLVLIVTTLGVVAPGHAADDDGVMPVEVFAKLGEFGAVTLSPTGEFLAVTVPQEGRTGMAVIDLDEMKVVAAKEFGRDTHVLNLTWVSDERLIGGIGESSGTLEQPGYAGELFAIDADGTTFVYLIGYRTERQERFYGSASVVDTLPDDDKYAVIATRPFQYDPDTRSYMPGLDKRAAVERIHVVSGRRDKIVDAPIKGQGSFVTDASGFVRYFVGVGEDVFTSRLFRRDPAQPDQWVEQSIQGLEHVQPVSAAAAGYPVYAHAYGDGDTECLFEIAGVNTAPRELACHDDVDIYSTIMASDGLHPIHAFFQPGRFETVNVAPDLEEAKLVDAIQARFAPAVVRPRGWSQDGNRLLFEVASDRTPGEVYLFDRRQRRAQFLLAKRKWVEPAKMAAREPIRFESRDGLTINGYLTRPAGGDKQKHPLVVLPHGGPIGIRDDWWWEPDAQFLASRGYAVLQINFRGSGGYGSDFLVAGRRQWGLGMIDDIVDGTRWAVENGVADPARMCIYGASYGGYAALMTAVREPDLFRCVVGYVGVYDLRTWVENTDVSRSASGQSYIQDYVGKSDTELKSQSPMQQLDRLKAPMLIVHGEEDQRVPFSEAEALRDALRARDHPHEWMARDKEGHGFYALDNRVAFYETLEAFLDKHIGR